MFTGSKNTKNTDTDGIDVHELVFNQIEQAMERNKISNRPKPRIVVARGEIEMLRKIFKCSRTIIWQSLTFRRDDEVARKIRKAAIERGGVELESQK